MANIDRLKTLTYETTGRIARITLTRPERGNGITLDMPAEIAACVERANLDPNVHVIALAGNGKGFCEADDQSTAEGTRSLSVATARNHFRWHRAAHQRRVRVSAARRRRRF